MYKRVIAPASMPVIGPYSPGIEAGHFLFCSGQLPIDPQEGDVIIQDIAAATNQVMKNLKTVLMAAGLGLENVVKTTIYLKDMNDFPVVNNVYKNYFKGEYPARTTISVAALPFDSPIEIEAIAAKP
jgi:2-iminobutanoate/2-iminopropanoate deaminase